MYRFKWITFSILVVAALLITAVTAAPTFAQGGEQGDRLCTGDNITLRAGEAVGDLLAFGCNIRVEAGATVRGDVALFGGNADVNGTVNGSIVVFGGNVAVGSQAVVNGDVNTLGGNIRTDPGATIRGTIGRRTDDFRPVPPIPPTPSFGFRPRGFFEWGFDVLGSIVTAIAFAALGALIILFAPDATRRVGQAAQAQPFGAAGVGCLTLIVIPILAILLTITIIGIPIAAVLGLAAVVAWVFGWIAIGYLTGEKILQALQARAILPVAAVVLGILVLAVAGQIPLLGWLVSLVIGLLGLGAVVLTRFGTRIYPAPPTMTMVPFAAAAAPPPTAPSPPPTTISAAVAPVETKPAPPEASAPPEAPPPSDTPPA